MIAKVYVDIPSDALDRAFDYICDDSTQIGSRVVVPFGGKKLIGFVLGVSESSDVDQSKLKSVIRIMDTPLSDVSLNLLRFMCEKYHTRVIDTLRLFVPLLMRSEDKGELQRIFVTVTPNIDFDAAIATLKRSARQANLLTDLHENGGAFLTSLTPLYGAAAVDALVKKGFCEKSEKTTYRVPYGDICGSYTPHVLTDDQKIALKTVQNNHGGKFLLHGVTGSGKTEIYQTLIEDALNKGLSAIMLVPEISLTPQMMRLFRARFGEEVALLHSSLSDGERYDEWQRLSRGEAHIALGARSAIFAPLNNLDVIIIDEEHEPSYISESNPRYDTTVVAEQLSALTGATLVLGSATPKLETYYRAQKGEFTLITLDKRIAGSTLPDMEIVDMALEARRGNSGLFSERLRNELTGVLERGEQAMIYLNRRGYSSFLMCRDCGYIRKCEECDVSLTYHREDNRLKCHYCGKQYTVSYKCPKCGSNNVRQGRSGTEQVVSELNKLFPKARVLRLDKDTTTVKSAYGRILGDFANEKADILVGTQMIAKGHDFAKVTLVGILDADFSLFFADYRANERTFQLVTQVAGRAGRADRKGLVVLQTYAPRHHVFYYAKSYNYRGFFEKELNSRELTNYPPFTVIVRVLVSSTDVAVAKDATKHLLLKLRAMSSREYYSGRKSFIYLDGMMAPVQRIKNKTRIQILMRLKPLDAENIIGEVYKMVDDEKAALSEIGGNRETSIFVEINPQNMM